jgi:diguanylate cyclase (GGDEF)-like protein
MSLPEILPTGPDASFQAALDCYLSAIEDIADTIQAVSPEIGAACREQLVRLRERLTLDANSETLEASRAMLRHLLEDFWEKAREYNQALARDVNQTLAIVAQTEDSRSVRSVHYVERLVDFVEQMETAVRSGDMAGLASQAGHLRRFAESIELDSRDAYVELRTKMKEVQLRLQEAELLATLDPLTGVSNRREFDRQLAARIESQRPFCVLLFDLDEFKAVNDQLGHLYGDQLLKQLGARLSGQVRTRDFVCRWGGDEFVAILDCELAHAETRARQISQWINGPYRVTADGREIRVDLGVSVGCAQYVPGETPEQLFLRVDESMYRQKHKGAAG